MFRPWTLLLLGLSFASAADVTRLVDCYPEPGASEPSCQARGCIWQQAPPDAPEGTPWCFYPTASGFLMMTKVSPTNYLLTSATSNPYGGNISPLNVSTQTNGATLFVTIGNDDSFAELECRRMHQGADQPETHSYFSLSTERDMCLLWTSQIYLTTSTESLIFKTTVIPDSDIFAFQVVRQSTNTILWDTSIGGMQFADKFIQIATLLPSRNIFGFGEHIHQRLRHDLSRYTVWPMFARDIGPDSSSPLSTQNLYGVFIPFYICGIHDLVSDDGKAHGVFIFNSNAQEVVTGPGPHLVYRTIGGRLDLAFFPGPTPEEVVQQYLAYVGHPFCQPTGRLGTSFHAGDTPTWMTMRGRRWWHELKAAQVPLDVAYADIDYMERYKDFTVGPNWAGFGAYVDDLHNMGLHSQSGGLRSAI
ncbi:hypothetical protein OSTOST_16119 [Ostertagia ostertagi]